MINLFFADLFFSDKKKIIMTIKTRDIILNYHIYTRILEKQLQYCH